MLASDCAHLVGYGCTEGGPFLAFDRRDVVPWERALVHPVGQALTLRAAEGRYCTGRHDLRTRKSEPCPLRRAMPDATFEQCAECMRATGFNPAFYNAAEVSPQQRAYNQGGHLVYLAHFGGGLLKVGITHERRGIGRMLEQGARIGALLGRFDDAYGARALEARIAEEFEVAETVRSSRKRKLLGSPFRVEVARSELLAMVERIADGCPEVDPEPSVMEFDAHYGGLGPGSVSAIDLTDQPPGAPWLLSGECRAMIGDVLIVEGGGDQRGQRFMASIGALVGCAVELSREVVDNHLVGQMELLF